MRHLFVTAVFLGFYAGPMIASEAVPEFKIDSCRQAEESGSASRNAQACFQDEQNAQDTLKQNWTTYDSSQKAIVSG